MQRSRYLTSAVESDLARKMVFVAGPRQVGKTTFARSLLPRGGSGYLNWDVVADRQRILDGELPPTKLWVFDEIHKFRRWRNFLKGVYDGRRPGQKILVTGSAQIDFYRFGGDSLQGRYHMHRMHPLSVAELGLRTRADLDAMMRLGGFPEPYFGGDEVQARRWSREYRSRIVREELVSLESVKDVTLVELLLADLPRRVGSPLSVNALREDLDVSHKAVDDWLAILERLYAIFRLPPFGHRKIRAVKKERKHYHFDWTVVADEGPRFECLVAAHLLKWVNHREDTEGIDVELRYFRDTDGREVDFVVVEEGAPRLAVECKLGDADVDRSLRYFKARFPAVDAWQLSWTGRKDFVTPEGIRVAPAGSLLAKLV